MAPKKPAAWQYKRTMYPADYKEAIADLGMNIAQAGRYLGVSERTSHRYIRGEAEIPIATVLLLRALIATGTAPVVPDWVSDKG